MGRVTPHKKQEDAIKTLYYYKKFINANARLFIVGGGKQSYLTKLKRLVGNLRMENDVIFTGKVSFDELCTYYCLADVLLSMSQHEGFCVPLIEGMLFKKPVIAFEATAIPYTMGNSGILYDKNDCGLVAEMIHRVVQDESLRESVIAAQLKQLEEFATGTIKTVLERDLQRLFSLANER